MIGNQKADEILRIQALDQFFTDVIRYALLNDHSQSTLYSPDLTEVLLSSKVPTATKSFLGRKEELFHNHYQILQKLHSDSLIILDNFNVLSKDEPFFMEFIRNDFQVLVTTRCKITSFQTLEIKELDKENELMALFFQHCPSAKNEPEITSDIINELNTHFYYHFHLQIST